MQNYWYPSKMSLLVSDRNFHRLQGDPGSPEISSPSVSTILHDHLCLRKVPAFCMPENLLKGQMLMFFEQCQEVLHRFLTAIDSRSIAYAVSSYETWICQYDFETKC